MPRPLQSFMLNLERGKAMAAFISTALAQSIPNGASTTLTFATPTNNDPLGLNAWQPVWTATTPGQFTIPAAGFYAIGATICWSGAPTQGSVLLRKNGTIIADNQSPGNLQSVATMIPAVVGDVIDAQVSQFSGAPLATLPLGLMPNFWIIRVG